jgi:hypothetical protein
MGMNSCSSGNRCLRCPANVLNGEPARKAAMMIDAAAADPAYTHLPRASRGEILGMAQQTTERFGDRSLVAVVAGGILLVATEQCDRSEQ